MPEVRHVIVAPAAFKGTLDPVRAAAALAAGVSDAHPGARVVRCPIADGGDGTLQVLRERLGGDLTEATVAGPLGAPVRAGFAMLPGGVAVVEVASASGLHTSAGRDPLRASTGGTGELIAAALRRGPRRLLVGAGGSATSDGGSGIAQALGVRMLDAAGRPIAPGAAGLADLDRIEVPEPGPLAGVEAVVACDVDNPLLGPRGAARVFAPQKGAAPAEVEEIERGLARLAAVVERDLGVSLAAMPRAGAAGGAAGGMHALLGARLAGGFEVVADLLGFDDLLRGAGMLIVGEGSLDAQSLGGKAPVAAARRAASRGIPVVAIAGRVELGPADLAAAGIGTALDLTAREGPRAVTDPEGALRRAAREAIAV